MPSEMTYSEVREKVRQGKGLTPGQAQVLLAQRDEEFKMTVGMMNALMNLRPFMAETAPQWAKDKVKSVTDTNKGAIAEYEAWRLLRRKAILDNYGHTIENVSFERWCELVACNDALDAYWGVPMPDYIRRELDEIEIDFRLLTASVSSSDPS